ncbi:hypothetical protein UlMin_038767 [Ulmus minor]
MGFGQRKLLLVRKKVNVCKKSCPSKSTVCVPDCNHHYVFIAPDRKPPQPLVPKQEDDFSLSEKHIVRSSLLISGCMIGGVFILLILFVMIRRYYLKRRRLPILFDIQEDFVDEDHGPFVDHPIWYIHTIGLAQSVIDSITVCKYKKEEGLIEGTECSVCLCEFEEDESLRLLPKCSHAFHIPCIDTWLRSHKNCPLCRAPIVCENATAQVGVSEPNLNDSSSIGDTQMENSESLSEITSDGVVEGESSEARASDDVGRTPFEDPRNNGSARRMKGLLNSVSRSHDPRVRSDLGDKLQIVDEELQIVRRSVSLDASSAMVIYRDVARFVSDQGSSNSQADKNSSFRIVSKQGNRNLSLYKLMRSSSNGRSLRKGSTSMKRSSSSSRKLFSSTHGRSQSLILPL